MITLYTIGFTKKSAEQFFELLKLQHSVTRLPISTTAVSSAPKKHPNIVIVAS